MAFANFGTGTVYYGKCDFGRDGSHVTTEFVAVLWIPLIPLRSLRVKRRKLNQEILGWKADYDVYSAGRPNLKQVASVYGFVILLIAFIGLYSRGADYFPRVPLAISVLGAVAGIAVLSFLPNILRSRAMKRSGM